MNGSLAFVDCRNETRCRPWGVGAFRHSWWGCSRPTSLTQKHPHPRLSARAPVQAKFHRVESEYAKAVSYRFALLHCVLRSLPSAFVRLLSTMLANYAWAPISAHSELRRRHKEMVVHARSLRAHPCHETPCGSWHKGATGRWPARLVPHAMWLAARGNRRPRTALAVALRCAPGTQCPRTTMPGFVTGYLSPLLELAGVCHPCFLSRAHCARCTRALVGQRPTMCARFPISAAWLQAQYV